MNKVRIRVLTLAGFLAAVLVPQAALAAEAEVPANGPVSECLSTTSGSEAFVECLEAQAAELGWRDGWQERVRRFIADHPDWRERLAKHADRLEDRRDRREDVRDRREDRRDRMEDRRDQERDREDFFDRLEDRRDRREDRRDKWEDRWDRRKDRPDSG